MFPTKIQFTVIISLVVLILYYYYTYVSQLNANTVKLPLNNSSYKLLNSNISKFHHVQSRGEQYKLSDFDSKLIRKYWELQAWLKQLQGKDTTKTMPDPPEFFQFPNRYNLWDPATFFDSGSDEDRLIAQDVWRMQSLIKNYFNHTRLHLKPKRIYIGDLRHWQGWPLEKHWHASKSVSGCYEVSQSQNLAKLEPTCDLVLEEPEDWFSVDMLVSFQERFLRFEKHFPPMNLTKLIFTLESPYLTPNKLIGRSNRISSYWRRSLVVRRYNKWISYDPSIRSKQQSKDFSEGKSKMAAILVSNCDQVSNDRLGYVNELQKYIHVDVFGKCGSLSCDQYNCSKLFQEQYRFYLSFENANCRDYITEKLYNNAFRNELVPIVMGAHPDDYKSFAPQNSYIHIEDFESPQELASYLTFLAENPSYYNKYFEWKGTGEFTDYSHTEFFCRLCSMLHYDEEVKPRLSQSTKFDWLPDARINLNGDKMCLEKGKWYWNR